MVVAAVLALVALAVGSAPANAVTPTLSHDATPPAREHLAAPARAVADDVEAATVTTVATATYTFALLDARRREQEVQQLTRAAAFITAVQVNQRQQIRNAVWDRIAQCETGGDWHMRGSRFSGGVGFANSTWGAFGGQQFAPDAGLATREQQIVVAERVYDYGGYTGWGCAYTLGLVSH